MTPRRQRAGPTSTLVLPPAPTPASANGYIFSPSRAPDTRARPQKSSSRPRHVGPGLDRQEQPPKVQIEEEASRRRRSRSPAKTRPRLPPKAERALAMSCSVAIPSSPVFSPSRRPLSCKAASASPESVSVSVSSPAPSTAGSPPGPSACCAPRSATRPPVA
ncbi:hypothetical protein ZWY2020_034313 [Hordeum vulgare]|nr:hypothetical protein ZWY2020_034313 [Hordeum vulgare]